MILFVAFLIDDFSTAYTLQHFTSDTSLNILVGQNTPPVKTLCGIPFRDLNNLLQLLLRSMTAPKNQYETFSMFCLHSHAFWKNFQKVTHSITISSQAHLTLEFLSDRLPKKYIYLIGIGSIN